MRTDAAKILLVDDEADVLEFMKYNLEKEGYEVYLAENGKEGIRVAERVQPDLIILDIMMPEMNGVEACRVLRSNEAFQNTVITFLTARDEDYSQIAGLESGADDYISKPIKPKVLLSRIKALLRRNRSETQEESVVQIGDLKLDRSRFLVTLKGEPLNFPKKEFELLELLTSKPGKVFPRQMILSKLWGDTIVGDRTIDVHIRKLREKLGRDAIVTIVGIGYKFEPSPDA